MPQPPTQTKLSSSPASAEAVCINPKQVWSIWKFVAPWIRQACKRSDLARFREIEEGVLAGNLLLWLAWDGERVLAAATTEIALTEKSKICTIVAAGGRDRNRWLSLIGSIEKFAKNEECDAVRIFGRVGWERVLPDEYKAIRVVLERKL